MTDDTQIIKMWESMDHSLTSYLLSKITTNLECSICSEIMIIPMTIECGHSFCYDCIYQWFSNKINCPTCRHDIENKPILNIHLKEICHKIIESIIENTSNNNNNNESNVDHLMNRKLECLKTYNLDVKNKSIFGDLFNNTVTTLIDCSDGVARCGNCHWEVHGSICSHCGTRFRRSTRNINGESEEDEDEEEDDDEDEDAFEDVVAGFRQSVEINEYDSDDSFIDSRTANEIPVGTDSDSEISIHINTNNNNNVYDNESNENNNTDDDDEEEEYGDNHLGHTESFGNNSAIHDDWHGFESATSSVIDRAFSDDDDEEVVDEEEEDVSIQRSMNSPYNNDSIELSSSEHENIIQLSGDDEDDSYYDSEDIRDAMEEMDNFNIDNTDYNNEEDEEEDDDVVELSDYNSYSDNMISDVDNDNDGDDDGWW